MGKLKIYSITLFFSLISLSVFGQNNRREKSDRILRYGDYQYVCQLSPNIDLDDIALQFKTIGQLSLKYGLYQKASDYYKKALLLDKSLFHENDVIDYYYTLLKSNRENEVINNPIGKSFINTSKEIRQLIKNAKSRTFYRKLKIPDIDIKKMNLQGIIPCYGLIFNDYYLYALYQRGKIKTPENSENNVFSYQVSRRSYIGQVRLISQEKLSNKVPIPSKHRNKGVTVTLYKSQKDKTEFYTILPENGAPEQIGINSNKFPDFPFNSRAYACAMPFFDQKTNRLYFCSTMLGGMGGWDIYYCIFNGKEWTKPVNMGSEVNSAFDELFPFVYDNRLCYSSDGWEGYGGFDNYLYNMKKDCRTNLIFANSPGDDFCFQVIKEKKLQGVGIKNRNPVFFSSDQSFSELINSTHHTIPEEIHNDSTISMNTFLKPQEEKPLPKAQPVHTIPQKKDTIKVIPKKQKIEKNPRFNSVPITGNRITRHDLLIKASGKNTRDLGTVYFDFNTAVIKRNYFTMLDNMVKRIIEEDIRNIVVWGGADQSGKEKYNAYLSYMRAMGITEYLKSRLGTAGTHRFVTIIAGEECTKVLRNNKNNDRRVVVCAGERALPYPEFYVYKALPKQSLSDVAAMFNNDKSLMMQINKITSMPQNRLLLVGIQGIHLVKTKDNLFRIAQKYHCNVADLQRLNNKKNKSLYVGEKLFIPLHKNK
mgnify:CR=1 FL=1